MGLRMKHNHQTRKLSEEIIRYMESKVCCEPPEPFLLAGRIIRDMQIRPSDFYLAMGHVIGYRVGEYREGKKKYYYLLEMISRYQEYLDTTKNNRISNRSNE